MEFIAQAKYQRVSPQKARLVLDLIKGKRVEQALDTLHFANKRIAPDVAKLLKSAVQNATYLSDEKGLDVDVDNLIVKRAIANEGPRMKRIRPAPMGRAYRYQRRMTHMVIALEEKHAKSDGMATVVGEESAPRAKSAKSVKKPAAKKTAAKKR